MSRALYLASVVCGHNDIVLLLAGPSGAMCLRVYSNLGLCVATSFWKIYYSITGDQLNTQTPSRFQAGNKTG